VTVLGSAASIQPGEFIQASGRWDNHREHGIQFKTTFLKGCRLGLSRPGNWIAKSQLFLLSSRDA